jgi:hypothetical protein
MRRVGIRALLFFCDVRDTTGSTHGVDGDADPVARLVSLIEIEARRYGR